MEQRDIDRIEDDAEREKQQRIANQKLTEELSKMTKEQSEKFRRIAGYGGL